MPKIPKNYSLFISCPSDLSEEKKIIKEICRELTEQLKTSGITIKAFDYTDLPALAFGRCPQDALNFWLKHEDYDIYFGMFWKRFGSKGNGETPTEEEFENAYSRYKKKGRPVIM
jgi:hypothetical protein